MTTMDTWRKKLKSWRNKKVLVVISYDYYGHRPVEGWEENPFGVLVVISYDYYGHVVPYADSGSLKLVLVVISYDYYGHFSGLLWAS